MREELPLGEDLNFLYRLVAHAGRDSDYPIPDFITELKSTKQVAQIGRKMLALACLDPDEELVLSEFLLQKYILSRNGNGSTIDSRRILDLTAKALDEDDDFIRDTYSSADGRIRQAYSRINPL